MVSSVSTGLIWCLAITFGALVLGGCSAPPEKQIAEAQEAAENAKTARVELYAPELAARAETALRAAETEIAAQDEKFVVLRNYKDAALKLTEAMDAFSQATAEATNQRAQLKGPVRALVKNATFMVDAVEQEVAKLTARRPASEVVSLQDQVAVMRKALADAAAAEKGADYVTAKATLDQVLAEATELRHGLDPNWVAEPPAMATPPPADTTATRSASAPPAAVPPAAAPDSAAKSTG